jgi:tRNA U38,U39,U40 pseudouridine synthase TruA
VGTGTTTTAAAAEATLAAGRTDEGIVAGLAVTTMDGRCQRSQVASRLVEAAE